MDAPRKDDNPLGSYLKDRRARLDPVTLGFAATRRRTRGLRREEVAQRAHISATWYTWLEQGRGGAPSPEVLDRIARALMLTDVEREHLFLLGLGRPPEPRYAADAGATVSPRIQRVLDALPASPAFVKVLIQVYEGERAMTADNNTLGKFQLDGIPPMPRGVPQIEVTFDIDANGILNVSALEKSTGKSSQITITNEKGRLSQAEIDRMVKLAAEYEKEDQERKGRIEAQNQLENYCYTLRNTLSEEKLKDKFTSADKDTIENKIKDTLSWIEKNHGAEKSTYEEKLKELEGVANPILMRVYQEAAGSSGGMPGGMPGAGGMPDFGAAAGGHGHQHGSPRGHAGKSTGPSVEEVD